MKTLLLTLSTFFLLQSIWAQQIDSIIALPSFLQESSGLIYFNQKLITHTDSGGENALYEIDTLTGQILRTVYLENASNIDWEDIAQDENFIYVADFGNNQGNRTNLKIFIIDKIDFENTLNDSVSVAAINFSYENQTNFIAQNQNTNFDAEALIAKGDSLYIFTKNWINQETNVYRLPKIPGTFSAQLIDSFDVNGLLTGASINIENNQILLCGYTKFASPFLFEMKNYTASSFFSGDNIRTNATLKGSPQIEAICYSQNHKFYMSSERFLTAASVLHQVLDTSLYTVVDSVVETDTLSSLVLLENACSFYPNPIHELFKVNSIYDLLMIYDAQGKLVLKTKETRIDVKNWQAGIYFVYCFFNEKLSKVAKLEKL